MSRRDRDSEPIADADGPDELLASAETPRPREGLAGAIMGIMLDTGLAVRIRR